MEQDVVRAIEFRGFVLCERGHQSHFLVQGELGDGAASLGDATEPPSRPAIVREQSIPRSLRTRAQSIAERTRWA